MRPPVMAEPMVSDAARLRSLELRAGSVAFGRQRVPIRSSTCTSVVADGDLRFVGKRDADPRRAFSNFCLRRFCSFANAKTLERPAERRFRWHHPPVGELNAECCNRVRSVFHGGLVFSFF